VYQGTYHRNTVVAVKVIERGSHKLISTEINILKALRGASHVVQLIEAIEGEITMLIFEHVTSMRVDEVLSNLSIPHLRFLLRGILEALRASHAIGVIHRDVKLGNILVSPGFSDVTLIDWGCGTFVHEGMSCRAGSRPLRPPEVLFGYEDYGYGGDIWAVGVLILSILNGGPIPWRARNSAETLVKLSSCFGGDALCEVARSLDLEIDPEVDDELYDEPESSLEDFVVSEMEHLQNPLLMDLMKKLLTLDPKARPTAEEALRHSFFQD
jgi:serine/threonine protein kinase